jgi:hypothetical protein
MITSILIFIKHNYFKKYYMINQDE